MPIDFQDPLQTLKHRTHHAERLGILLNELQVAKEVLQDKEATLKFADRNSVPVLNAADLKQALLFGIEIMIGQTNGDLDHLLRGLGLLDKSPAPEPKEIED